MPRDYKHRVQSSSYNATRRRQKKGPTLWWRWLLVAALIVAFIVFLNMIRNKVTELVSGNAEVEVSQPIKQEIPLQPKTTATNEAEKKPEPKPEPEPEQPVEPSYDFYTILPQAETVVPDYEIKSRVREELVGKTKASKYMMQAGSFREAADAERHKARLATLGIEAKVEKAKVGNVNWHRIKIGPYDNPTSVATIKELLQKNGIGVIVTEQGK
ncbi:sporulation protein [Methylomonas lenta]|uniref:Sporulation protein n=1 Tax=Methylomonas lenta TaxID=980561 RepID=A0A177N2G5_9GAMM|nr:SPOR domain-containing protein [Methylomonas lenta]OAI12156.1 sporulation protein [Methylomonas lenta]